MNKAIVIIILLLTCFSAESIVKKGYSSKSTGGMEFKVDSIDFRQDLTRIYGRLTGIPHTANRIDAIHLSGQMLPKGGVAEDIDGIDFKRWFQWEDNGSINLEIDFPPCNKNGVSATMIVDSPKGECVWTITQIKSSKIRTKRK